MRKKILAMLLVTALSLGAFTGCGNNGADSGEDPAAVQESVAETEEQEESEEAGAETEGETAEDETEDQASQEVNTGEGSTEIILDASVSTVSTGDFQAPEELAEPTDTTEEEAAEMDRAIRAYTPSASGYLKNKGKDFYYYSQLDSEGQKYYDAFYKLCEDPTGGNMVSCKVTMDSSSEEFRKKYTMAYHALIYDHPELFWLYNSIDTDINLSVFGDTMYCSFTKSMEDYSEKMKAFNDAVDNFLFDIDTSGSQMDVALRIHDKLCELVTYDNDTLNNMTYNSYAHTAYGALVQDSAGKKNSAVCDGYSLAYEYLLQQVGIQAAVVCGQAGSTSSSGGHAWNMANLDGKWYEIDSTWNDVGTTRANIEALSETDSFYPYYVEALNDAAYTEKIGHYLFGVSTLTMTNFVSGEEYRYYTSDGQYWITLVGDSFHTRAMGNDINLGAIGYIMDMLPIAS